MFVAAPDIHVAALKNPALMGGPYINCPAEANPGLGNTTAAATVSELLTQRRYSLLWERHRWIDVRRYNQLPSLGARDVAGLVIHDKYPIPTLETDARQ
jgi:hypothetical protein